MENTLYRRSIVVDATVPFAPLAAIHMASHGPEDVVKADEDAGVTLSVYTVVDDYPNSIEQTVKLISQNRRYFQDRSKRLAIVDCVDDVRKAKTDGKMAVAFAFQGTNAMLGDIALVETYRQLGVIQMLLAYNMANFAADGCHEARNAGLSLFGRRLIAEMNRVGVMVDVTHVGLRSSLEALELTTKPAIFSHSTPKKFAAHDRNITDEQIRACASKGGVICLAGVGLFMDPQRGKASVSTLTDTIEYVVQMVGARHAGIGLDYSLDTEGLSQYLVAHPELYGGGGQYPADGRIDFAAPSVLPEIADELSRRKYSDADVQGVLGENYLRVWGENTCDQGH